ncbi:MAG: response regulator [Lachnospiraceae bacterium]|nr:response regulator [Lachnospiraceae bacterium]
MYHCHIHFYLAGCQKRTVETIKGIAPLKQFTHTFAYSDDFEETLAAEADVILLGLHEMDAGEAVRRAVRGKRDRAEIIVLADKEQISLFTGELPEIKDIWTMPMTDEELEFRFLRWQQTYKMGKDYWQTSHYFESTINSSPNLIWFKDIDGIHKKVNSSFCEMVNKTKEQVEGQKHAYIWDVEEDDPACIESEQKVMQSRRTCVSEEIVQTSGGERTLITFKSPLYDLDDSVMGTVGIAIDVTREREYEREVVRKTRALETIFTSIDCGVICHSLDGKHIISVNEAALKILGCESKEELYEKGFDMVASSVLDEDRDYLQQKIEELKNEGDSASVEYRVCHKDGTILHITGNVKLLRENEELFYQRFMLDCTAQKIQEKKNARHQMELVQALSTDYSLVCFFDLDSGLGNTLRNDDYDGSLFGNVFRGNIMFRQSMELYAQDFVYEEDRELLLQNFTQEKIKEELEDKKTYCIKYRAVREEIVEYFEVKVVRVGIWDGHYGVVVGFHSVDAQTRSEMEQKEMLTEALSQANKASQAKSVFLSNMSHDIRTPMNAIVGFTSLAITHIDRQEQVKEYLEKIMTSGNHLLSLINDVLDMSRIESGKIHLEDKPCSLPDIVHGLCNILQADIRAKKLELYIDTVDVLNEEIYCDKLRLNQVLLNLVSNSVKYTEPGGSINIRLTEVSSAGNEYAKYIFSIRDTGIGMSKEFLEHIFEPFEREENSTISGIQGTGLGMAITKNIVDLMGGDIEVKSRQGEGTEFTVSFMFRIHSVEEKEYNISELKDCRALVVDSDVNSCESITHMLGQIGINAEWTVSEEEAVSRTREAASRKESYRVYVVGWIPPEIDGIRLARKICQETDEDVLILMLTAYDWVDIEVEAKQAGIRAFCSKPLFMSELKQSLYNALHGNEAKTEEGKDTLGKLNGGRILLAEDVELNQEIAVEILGDAGFTTEVADNGKIAVEMLEKSEPGYYQLVLMDIQMPVMNGYEATKAIRGLENKELASIPILAMSANAFEEDKQEALKCGMNGHIAKPIDIDSMFETLGSVLK